MEHPAPRPSWLLAVPVVMAVAFGCTQGRPGTSGSSAEKVLGRAPVPAGNPQTPEKVELGRILFFDRRLSGRAVMACATCHDPAKAWTDGRPRSIGPKAELDRNSPSLFNAAYEDFPAWDGFAASLEDHTAGAITFDNAMGADVPELLEALGGVPEYRDRFVRAFGDGITFDNVTRALAAFQRSLVAFDSPFDRYQAGDRSALTKEQQQGFELFQGRAACATCHPPPLFQDNRFHALGVAAAGPSKDDPGRFGITGDERDRGAFRTPTLRNVALTGPYMHNGSLSTLADVVAFYAGGGGTIPVRSRPEIAPLDLTEQERHALVAYLDSLTSTTRDARVPAVP